MAVASPPQDASEPWRLCVAPMMDWTDRHCRYFHRLLSPHARLYTEMVTADAIIHGDKDRLLGFNPQEHPVALQLGGSDPHKLALAAKAGLAFGYDEINLNCGCPSDRVQAGRFGACLMLEPQTVADCIKAMQDAVGSAIPVTIKCRIGIDDVDPKPFLYRFVETNAQAGCAVFIIHARKAWLQGLSPKENREVPPLDYDLVYQLKQDFPDLTIVLNGGLQTVADAQTALTRLDGVMYGRSAYQMPDILPQLEQALFGTTPPTDADIISHMADYMDKTNLKRPITRHMVGLFGGNKGARQWRRGLSDIPDDATGSYLKNLFAACGWK